MREKERERQREIVVNGEPRLPRPMESVSRSVGLSVCRSVRVNSLAISCLARSIAGLAGRYLDPQHHCVMLL